MDRVEYGLPIICVVDDSEDDLLVLKRTLKRLDVNNPLQHFFKADDALRFFESVQAKTLNVGFILLDVNLPGSDGVSFLKALRNGSAHRYVPVIMFTTSDADEDISSSYKAGANAYVTKPVATAAFADALQNIINFWLKTVRLPPVNIKEF